MKYIPEQLRAIIKNLNNQKWIYTLLKYANIYIVGGSVRDSFLSKKIKDVDIVVDGGLSLNEIQRILEPLGNQKLVGESFGVIKFKPFGYVGEDYDIAIPRIDKKIGSGHKGFDVITNGVSILEDLKRRDFTINSMAIDILTKELIDPFNGKNDIINKSIKATDITAFSEDPLRILRGIQFAARFGFDIEPSTLKLMKDNSQLIKSIPGERILDEFEKIINKKGDTQIAIDLIHRTNIDIALFNRKFNKDLHQNNKLDKISFYYMLAKLAKTNPYVFYMERLRGNIKIGKGILVLNNILNKWNSISSEEEKRYYVFKSIQESELILNSILLPKKVNEIIDLMLDGNIPISPRDIKINGNDVMTIGNIKGKAVGEMIKLIQKAALMNKFDWKNRLESIKYLKSII